MTKTSGLADEKLQKVLARAGLGSRRTLERWINARRITVNGKVARLGDRVSERDCILVDGSVVPRDRCFPSRAQLIRYHKPQGQVCTRSDERGRETVFESLPRPVCGRWISIGRLDINSTGLLLVTTDGELANRLMHPSAEVEREYAVRVLGEVNAQILERMQSGVELDDGPARFTRLLDAGGRGANHWYHVVLREGRKREVRRLWESQGCQVSRLIRIRFGPVILPSQLRPGAWELLPYKEAKALYRQVGLSVPDHLIAPRTTTRQRRRITA